MCTALQRCLIWFRFSADKHHGQIHPLQESPPLRPLGQTSLRFAARALGEGPSRSLQPAGITCC